MNVDNSKIDPDALINSKYKLLKYSYILWAAYMMLAGALLLLVPNFLTELFSFHTAQDGWIRLFGALAFVIGAGYAFILYTKPNNLIIIWTIAARLFFFTVTVIAALLGWIEAKVVLVGLFDLVNALWSTAGFVALLRSKKS